MGFSIKKAFSSVGDIVEAATTKPIKATVDTVKELAKGDIKGAVKEAKKANPITEQAHAATGASRDTIIGTIAATAAAQALAGGAAGGATGAATGTTSAATGAAAGGATGAAAGAAGGAAGLAAGTAGGLGLDSLISLLGSGAAAAAGYEGSKYAADKSAKSAQQINERQIEWEKERATNAHQWEVSDLKAAGLNPVLSAGGQGAVTGGISAVQPDTSGYQSAGGALKTFIDTLNQTRLMSAQSSNINAQTTEQLLKNPYVQPKMKADIMNTISNTELNEANANEAISRVSLNAAKGVEAYANARFQERRASGKSRTIHVESGANLLGKTKLFGKGLGIKGGFTYSKTD